MRIALIANPGSGGGLDPGDLAEMLLGHGAQVRTFAPGNAAEGIDPDWAERIVVAGGDGTVGLGAALAARLDVPLAHVPAGTANDFARALELPEDPEAACALAATGTHTRRLDLGRIDDGHPFVNVASAGLASVAAREATPLKDTLGPLAYAVGAARAGMTGDPVSVTARVDDRVVFTGEAWQAIVSVTGAFGGGSDVEAADPHDGRLDVTIVPDGARLGLLKRAWGLRSGAIVEQAGVVHQSGRTVELELAPGTELNVDGEVLCPERPRFTVEPAAFALVVP